MVIEVKRYLCDLSHEHTSIQDAFNCDRFNLDMKCPRCMVEAERDEKICKHCGTELSHPNPCVGHRPGSMVSQGFTTRKWKCPINADLVIGRDGLAWGNQCVECGYIEFGNFGNKPEDWRFLKS